MYNKFTTMRFLGRFLWNTRAIKMYHDGDCIGYVWNWINPLSWVLSLLVVPLALVVTILFAGINGINERFPSSVGLTVNPFFKKNPDKLRWITHEEYKNSFK